MSGSWGGDWEGWWGRSLNIFPPCLRIHQFPNGRYASHVDFVILCVWGWGWGRGLWEEGHWFWFSCHIQHPLSPVPWPRQCGGRDATNVQPEGPAHPLCAPGGAACSHSHCASCVIPCAWGQTVAMEQRDMGRGYRHRCLDGCWR